MTDWARLAVQYNQLVGESGSADSISALIGEAASNFPRDSVSAQQWFAIALSDDEYKFFAAAVLGKVNPLPRTLANSLAGAAIAEMNPSAVRVFVRPLERLLGADGARSKLRTVANVNGASANQLEQALYWVSSADI